MNLVASAASVEDLWSVQWHPDVFAVVGTLVVGYASALQFLGPRLAGDGPVVTRRQLTQFGAGVLLIFVFAFWPVHDLAAYLFSVHMLQHNVFSLVATPLLLLGTPPWLLTWLIRPILPVMRRLVRPIPATLLFNGFIAISHAAVWVNFTAANDLAHALAHVALITVAAVMWLPVIHRLRGLPPMSTPVRMVYLFLQSILPNVPTAFLVFAETGVYAWYTAAPRLFGIGVVEDQQTAGAIMKLGGTMVIWTTITVMFFRWYGRSERGEAELDRGPAIEDGRSQSVVSKAS